MSLTVPIPSAASQLHPSPPGAEIGAESLQPAFGVSPTWSSFIDDQEYVPDLKWPLSVKTYHRMRSDSQIEALHIGTVQPVREFRWSIDPNGAPASLAEQAADDLGLPIRGHEDDTIGRGPRLFDFDEFLDDALLAPLYGHFHFEIAGEQDSNAWHMLKLAPRHPRTIAEFLSDNTGDLLAIRQNIPGAAVQGNWQPFPPPIPASKLIPFVWRKEAGNHTGRSLLRSLYREWLVKDRTIRVAAINIERAGGMPVIEGSQGASDAQLRDLAKLARTFKVAEGGGGAIPFGSKLTLVGGSTPDAISLLEYCDQAMSRVWSLMLVQLGLGSSSSGNRALGGEFAIYAARAQRAMAKWVCRSVNAFLDLYTEWNLGENAAHAPLLHYEQDRPDSMSVAELVSLIEVKALTVDPELESWLRSEHGLPEYTPPTTPELGDLTPQEVALVQNSRNPPALPTATTTLPAPPLPGEPQSPGPSVQDQTIAASPFTPVTLALPDRPLHRAPNQHEIAARVNLRSIDQQHQSVAEALKAAFTAMVIPAQITALVGQVLNTKAGMLRQTVTKTTMANLSAPTDGIDQLVPHLTTAARDGAHAASAELAAQGVTATIPDDNTLTAHVQDIANAVAAISATALTLSAQRKASSLVGGGRSTQDIATDLETYLKGLKWSYTADQLNGAVTAAQNSGRIDVFGTVSPNVTMSYYASEILDNATCEECIAVDGTEYPDLAAASQDYSAGGYVDCLGGARCRGTLVGVAQEDSPSSGSPSSVVSDVL